MRNTKIITCRELVKHIIRSGHFTVCHIIIRTIIKLQVLSVHIQQVYHLRQIKVPNNTCTRFGAIKLRSFKGRLSPTTEL